MKKRGREAESCSEGQRLIRGEGRRGTNRRGRKIGAGGEEAAGSRCAPCPAAWHCMLPIHTPGSRQGGRQAGREGGGMTPGKEGTTPTAQGTDGHRTHREHKGRGIKQDETKQKQREKSRLVGVLSLGSGHRLGGRWEGVRQEESVHPESCFSSGQVDLLPSRRTPHLSLF